jgi:YidC/Oxa1 family membrane protein insertase
VEKPVEGVPPAAVPGVPAGAPGAPVPAAPGGNGGGALPVEPAAEGPQALIKAETFAELENPKLKVRLTSLGAGVDSVLLKDAHDPERSDAKPLVVRSDPRFPTGGIDTTELVPASAPGGGDRKDPPVGALLRLNWSRDAAEETRTLESDVVYRFETADGRLFFKQWFLPPEDGRYDLRLRLWVRAKASGALPPQEVKLLASGGVVPEEPRGSSMGLVTGTVFGLQSQDDVESGIIGFPVKDVKPGGLGSDALRLVGTRNQYFLFAAYAAPGLDPLPTTRAWATGASLDAQPAMGERLKTWFEENTGRKVGVEPALEKRLILAKDHTLYAWLGLTLPGAADAKPVELAFYAGPVERDVLRSDTYRPLAVVITYPGGPDWLADILLWIYDRWRLLLGSVGLAVLLMTLTVRGLLMPLSIRNQLGMRRYGRKVQKLKPKVAELKKRYEQNPKKLREETMLLYREHGIGFPSGCLMMLLQIPIFFALFASLRMEFTLRGASFLWIRDLSNPDRLIDLPSGFPLISSINLLPILLVILSIVQTRSMPKPMDEQQAQQMRMMKWMPILFAVILYSYTAALALYMVVSSAIALIESKIVRKRDELDIKAA